MTDTTRKLPDEVMVWHSHERLDHLGSWATTRYPEEAVAYVPKSALAPIDGLALVRELRAERDAADQRAGAMLARIVALEADGEAARSAASTNFARAETAEAERDRLAAANAVLEAKVAGLVEAVKPFDAVGGTLFSKNWNMSDIVFDGGPMRSDCLFFEDFLNLRAALATQEAGTC